MDIDKKDTYFQASFSNWKKNDFSCFRSILGKVVLVHSLIYVFDWKEIDREQSCNTLKKNSFNFQNQRPQNKVKKHTFYFISQNNNYRYFKVI